MRLASDGFFPNCIFTWASAAYEYELIDPRSRCDWDNSVHATFMVLKLIPFVGNITFLGQKLWRLGSACCGSTTQKTESTSHNLLQDSPKQNFPIVDEPKINQTLKDPIGSIIAKRDTETEPKATSHLLPINCSQEEAIKQEFEVKWDTLVEEGSIIYYEKDKTKTKDLIPTEKVKLGYGWEGSINLRKNHKDKVIKKTFAHYLGQDGDIKRYEPTSNEYLIGKSLTHPAIVRMDKLYVKTEMGKRNKYKIEMELI